MLRTYITNISSLSILHDFIRSSVMRLRSFFTILSDRSNLRSQRSSEIDVSLVLAQKEEKTGQVMNGLRRGKNFEKIHCAIFESKKFWCDAPPLSSPPFCENGEKVSRSPSERKRISTIIRRVELKCA